MAKKKTVTIESAEALGEGLFKIINSDGSFIMAIQISEAAIGLLAPEAEEDEEDEEEESVSLDEMKDALIESGVTKKALKKMSDEEIEEAYNDLETEDEDEEEADDDDDEEEDEDSEESDDEDGEDGEDSDEDEDDEEEVTPEALSEMDYEELEDLCDDKELDTDPDDFEEDQIEKFRSAVAKELGIKLPKAKKGKK